MLTTECVALILEDGHAHPRPLSVLISAWAVPLLVAGQFAMLAVVPVAVVVITTFRNPDLRAFRGWAAGLAAAYALPLALWAIGPDRAQSPSKDMHPAVAALLVAVSVVVAIAFHVTTARRNAAALR